MTERGPVRITLVPPYRGAGYDFQPEKEPYYQAIFAGMRQAGELDGVELTVDRGAVIEHRPSTRDEDFFAHMGLATLDRVKEVLAEGAPDAIAILGSLDPAFYAMRTVSTVPIVHMVHAALHVASIISDRITIIDVTDPLAVRDRRLARAYGFDWKVGSVRTLGFNSTELGPLLRLEDPRTDPTVARLLDRVVEVCATAINEDRAESLIFAYTPMQVLRDEVRARLDAAGFAEIPLVWMMSAAVAVARLQVDMGLMAARRSYPNDQLDLVPFMR